MKHHTRFGFVCGAWDIMHVGYIRLLKDAKDQCDYLIVGIQKDPSVDRPEKNKPVNSLSARIEVLEALDFIDRIIPYTTEKSLYKLLKKLHKEGMLDIRINGSDHKGKPFTGDDLPVENYFHPRRHYYSCSLTRKLMKKNYEDLIKKQYDRKINRKKG